MGKPKRRGSTNSGSCCSSRENRITIHTIIFMKKSSKPYFTLMRNERLLSSANLARSLIYFCIGVAAGVGLAAILATIQSNKNGTFKTSLVENEIVTSSFNYMDKDIAHEFPNAFVDDKALRVIKPTLVIHIGPSKTASTTLQTSLTEFQDYLRKDNFVYVGRQYKPFTNRKSGKFILNRLPDSPAEIALRHMFSPANKDCQPTKSKVDCCANFMQILLETYYLPYQHNNSLSDKDRNPGINRTTRQKLWSRYTYNQRPPNLLISDESLLKHWNNGDVNSTTALWNALYESLTETWNVVLVSTYRRFYEWLPSAKAQKDKPSLESWRADWPTEGGTALSPLFPDGSSSSTKQLADILAEYQKTHFLSDLSLSTIKSLQEKDNEKQFQLKIFHLYGTHTPRTTFLCNVLSLKYSCRESRRRESLNTTATRLNAQNIGMFKPVLSKRATIDPLIILEPPLAYYDALATEAAVLGLVDTKKWRRQKVAELLRKFDREIHQRPLDVEMMALPLTLPLICPSRQQLKQLLHLSLRIEAEYLPKLYNKGQRDHRIAFQSTVNTRFPYCWVSTGEVLNVNKDYNTPHLSSIWHEYVQRTFQNVQ